MQTCNKNHLFKSGLSLPSCTRFATQRLELEATRGSAKGARVTSDVCDPCAGMLNRTPGIKIVASTPIPPATPTRTRRERIEANLDDMITDLLYYDRKDDETLPVGAIEDAVKAGEITVEEIVKRVAARLRVALETGVF
jgi:hypothetical protein